MVSANIPDNRLTIFGYTSPFSRVEISNTKLFSVTYSDNNGYFIFDRIIIPKNSGEYCLNSIDESNRSSPFLCLPSLPPTKPTTNIGPIVIAPTLSQDLNSQGLTTSGQTVPSSTVNIQLFQIDDSPNLVKSANAFSLPQFKTTTDKNGNFSLNLPTQYSSEYRYYATIVTKDLLSSPKSNILWYQNATTTSLSLFIFAIVTVIIILVIIFIRKHKNHPVTHHHLPATLPHYWPRLLYQISHISR